MTTEMPLIVARNGQGITGSLMATTRAMNAEPPIVKVMFTAYQGG